VTGDGVLDLVTANGDGTLTVLMGRGDGTFASFAIEQAPGFGTSVALADVNGDGVPDIATAGLGVRLLVGTGEGAMGRSTTLGSQGEPIDVAIADLDGDGHADLAVANAIPLISSTTPTASVFMGHGDGTFEPLRSFAVGSISQSIAVGDFDLDGRLDLAVANFGDGTVSVLFGNGDGTFAPQQIVAVGGVSMVAVGDIDGDGVPDLAVAKNGEIGIVRSNRDRTFAAIESYPCGCGRLALADVDRDGLLDIVGVPVSVTEYGRQGGEGLTVFIQRHPGSTEP
jgi:hypothetical protein